MQTVVKTIIALDFGSRRIGVAIASIDARLPRPLTTITNNDQVFDSINSIVDNETAVAVVVGLPRGLSGQETAQTNATKKFIEQLKSSLSLPVYMQDEAVTSIKAEAELRSRNKTFSKTDIDALAASYILDDFLQNNPQVANK